MLGYENCKELKKLRKQIADANGIPYEIEECDHYDCRIGTCPKCDAEEAYLMAEIRRLEAEGKETSLDGLCAEWYVQGQCLPEIPDIPEPPLMGIPAVDFHE